MPPRPPARSVPLSVHLLTVPPLSPSAHTSAQGLYPFGDLKQASAGCPVNQLMDKVPEGSGEWSVMRSKMPNVDDKLIYLVAHRRGASIHTYLSTHGVTVRGKDQKHKDDTGEDGACGPPRKCPRILNDYTQAQPHIDKHNRWRQFELAIEERFRTRSFPFRMFTTVIAGMSLANAWALYQYHVNAQEYESFCAFASDVAYDAMTNTYDADHSQSAASRSHSSPALSSIPTCGSTTANAAAHVAINTRSIVGWKGKHQQRCSECNQFTSFCCAACSDAHSIIPIHPLECTYTVAWRATAATRGLLDARFDRSAARSRCSVGCSRLQARLRSRVEWR